LKKPAARRDDDAAEDEDGCDLGARIEFGDEPLGERVARLQE
jgi:hypothetical protein